VVVAAEAQLSVRICCSPDFRQTRLSTVGDARRKDRDAGGAHDLPTAKGVFDGLPGSIKERRFVRLVNQLDI